MYSNYFELDDTYNNFLPMANICKEKREDYIKVYKETNDPTILAKLFINHYYLIIKESNKYLGLDKWDISSFAVEELHKALINFDEHRNVQFTTYYCTCLRNRLRSETQSLSYDKRKAMINCTEYLGDRLVVTGNFDSEHENNPNRSGEINRFITKHTLSNLTNFISYDNELQSDLLYDIENNDKLTEREKRYCKYVIKDTPNTKYKDFAFIDNISAVAVQYIKKSLQKKLNYLSVS